MEICKMKAWRVLMFLSFQVSLVSSTTDTISTNQPLPGDRTIVSRGEIFQLGFFNPKSFHQGYVYLGIWYLRVSPQTFVWIANREPPFTIGHASECSLGIANGNLIFNGLFNQIIWSTGVKSSRSKDVQAVLLDNGNLVLRDGPNSSAAVLWQSFDHPSDTWLPGAKIQLRSQGLVSWKTFTDPSMGRYSLVFDNQSNSLTTVWHGYKSYWSSGPWDDRLQNFQGYQLSFNSGSPAFNLRFKLNLDESYITYSIDPNRPCRLFMDVSGQFILQILSAELQNLNDAWKQPSSICAVYNFCGSFGICDVTAEINTSAYDICRCVPGFRIATDTNDFSGGCERITKLQCGKGNDEFIPIRNITLATDPETTNLVLTSNSCASACLANCSCNAYAYDGNKCFLWIGDAFNMKQLAANKGHTFFLRVAAPNQGEEKDHKVRNIVLPVVLSSLAAVAAFLVGVYCLVSSRRRRRRTRTQRDQQQSREQLEGIITDDIIDDDGANMCYLNLNDIMAATNSFSEENKLGEGGFGPVYKGKLPNGMDVAIKRLSKISRQGLTEFKNEVVLIIKLQHKNLVRLLGYCVEGDEKLLIYEYMPNKSLDVLLFDSSDGRKLDWEKRMQIVNGTTRGLQYLHEDSRLRIIHRDLKASNILLDDEMNPKISDFGTARIFGCKQIDDNTQRIVGTYGYMSPEYAFGGIISEKADIYSFGVLLLEIISGKKATRFVHNAQNQSLIAYAWESWCQTRGVGIIDEALCGSYSLEEVMRCVQIALLCVQDHPKDRPTISQIVYMLSNGNNLPTPKQPTFSNVLNADLPSSSSGYAFSINEATQTEMEAR